MFGFETRRPRILFALLGFLLAWALAPGPSDAATLGALGIPRVAPAPVALPATTAEFVALQRGDIEGRRFIGDGGFGIRTRNGTLINFYGDTVVSATGNPQYPSAATQKTYMMRNNAIIHGGGRIRSATSGTRLLSLNSFVDVPAAQRIPGGTNYYWPASAATRYDATAKVDRVYVFLSHMFTSDTGTGLWNFSQVGSRLAEYTFDAKGTLTLTRLLATPMKANDPAGIKWGAGAFVDAGYLYAFGSSKIDDPWIWGNDFYLARIPVSSIGTATAWRFWTAAGWSRSATAVIPVIPNPLGLEATLAMVRDPATGALSVSYKEFTFIGSRVMRITAPALTGPWTADPEPLATLTPLVPDGYTYCGTDIPLAGSARGVIVSHGNFTPGIPLEFLGIRAVI